MQRGRMLTSSYGGSTGTLCHEKLKGVQANETDEDTDYKVVGTQTEAKDKEE